MNELTFEWDERKAIINERKHGVSFEEASEAFYDNLARIIYDPEHSLDEDRYILIGISDSRRLLIFCHLYRENDAIIRIISARLANPKEHQQYQNFLP
ncbi:MAG: BrnT family toxin [Microcystis wesenbergii Mw_QC_B_20070930_S4]|jgi:uncharacterized DUF497 family protein|nr:BrnT family toxin [Microcystis aeruginosa W11-03]NCR95149.1 BrnT family toxin [Microcystis aeruginosa W11-06]TRV05256.1 MAG: BrnT family toxin [Microcystis wesenbergii Mw_QC_B_20070930_S4D]TRV14487.1 MAG: BrnT family toxin [Microcystis wesenbergii Mw_QC_B_20070930_S4]